jgi:hypothetical protein
MASGHVSRAERPNTRAHRPILHAWKKVLANSEPSTHHTRGEAEVGGTAEFAASVENDLGGVKTRKTEKRRE